METAGACQAGFRDRPKAPNSAAWQPDRCFTVLQTHRLRLRAAGRVRHSGVVDADRRTLPTRYRSPTTGRRAAKPNVAPPWNAILAIPLTILRGRNHPVNRTL